ncbi:efflux RND transporter periplasmic adaptor subunit [Peptococcaceae bacterium]|nr:efflux RND transporter periplasmic adaptor subunit [Peptococcaceae bacterium]
MDVLKNNWKKILSICIVVFLSLFILGFGLVRTDTVDLLASKRTDTADLLASIRTGTADLLASKRTDTADLLASESNNHVTSIKAHVVEKISIEDKISFTGDLEASEIEIVSSKIPARVKSVLVENGDSVSAGQELVILDSEDYERAVENAEVQLQRANLALEAKKAELAAAEAAYQNAVKNLNRMKILRDADAVTQKEYENAELVAEQAEAKFTAAKTAVDLAKSDIRAAELALEQAIANLNDTRIKSLISGVIANCNVKVGQLVSPGIPLIEVHKIDPIYVHIDIPQDNIKDVKVGQSVNVKVLAYPDKNFEGTVVAVEQVLDKKARSFGVKIHVPNRERLLKPGMSCEVEINVGTIEVLAVPQHALFSKDDKKYVFVIENNKVKSRQVETGRLINGMVEVKSGLSEGEKIAITNVGHLKDGDKVKVINFE